MTVSSDDTPIHSPDRCIMRGQCMENTQKTGKLNCAYNGLPAIAQEGSEELSILRSVCPMLYEGPDTRICCDIKQLTTLQNQTKAAKQILGGCPSCSTNFMDIFCRMTCDPNQAHYMAVTSTAPVPNRTDVVAALSISMYLGEEPFFQFYDSCLNVQFSSSQSRALDLLCGQPADSCTPTALMTFLGGVSHSPFHIAFTYANSSDPMQREELEARNMTSYNGRQYRCNETAPPDNKTCSCQVRRISVNNETRKKEDRKKKKEMG